MAESKKKVPGPEQGFTSRVWKILGGACEVSGSKITARKEGYQYNGGEVRAAAHLMEMGLVTDGSAGPQMRVVKATEEGLHMYAAYLAANG